MYWYKNVDIEIFCPWIEVCVCVWGEDRLTYSPEKIPIDNRVQTVDHAIKGLERKNFVTKQEIMPIYLQDKRKTAFPQTKINETTNISSNV